MKPAPFRLHRPTTIGEAVTLLAELGDDAKVLSGGQSLVPVLALRLSRFGHLIDLNGVTELDGVRTEGTDLVVGGLTRHAALTTEGSTAGIAQPLLPLAARLIGHPAIRNRGTHGGSIAHADPAAELPAAAVAVGATIEVAGREGTRFVAASDFFLATWETALQADEIVTAVRWPAWSGTCGWSV